MVISIGCDHAGFPIKGEIVAWLQSQGHTVVEHGCFDENPVDFPVIAREVCQTVLDGKAERGIMICGTGVGAAIACNKIPGIRASCCHDIYSAHQCVEHDDVNVGCVGSFIVGKESAKELLSLFLNATFSTSPEFRRRVVMLSQMDGSQGDGTREGAI